MQQSLDLNDQLPIFQMRDFDILLNQSWPIGIDSDAPSELRVRLSAASLSYFAGNKSIDYFRKNYLPDLEYPASPRDRLDKRIGRLLKDALQKLSETLDNLEPSNPKLGHMVSKWTFLRLPFSFDLALTCAQRGALFECLAIVRMILEQVAWALEICSSDDFDEITNRKAQQSLRALKPFHPAAGNFYGWLSAHAHWAYDAHIKAFHHFPGKIAMRLADPLYKGQALGSLIVLFEIVHAAYYGLYTALDRSETTPVVEAANISSLLLELLTLSPDDSDMLRLKDMLVPQEL
jgi:hypothetical protein